MFGTWTSSTEIFQIFVSFFASRFFKLSLLTWIPVIMRKFHTNWRRRKPKMAKWTSSHLVCLQIVVGFFWKNSWTERELVLILWEFQPQTMGLPEIQLQQRFMSLYPTITTMTPNFPEIFTSFQWRRINHMVQFSAPWRLLIRILTITQPLDTAWYPVTPASRLIRLQVSHFSFN